MKHHRVDWSDIKSPEEMMEEHHKLLLRIELKRQENMEQAKYVSNLISWAETNKEWCDFMAYHSTYFNWAWYGWELRR